jgi:hypothetical protein
VVDTADPSISTINVFKPSTKTHTFMDRAVALSSLAVSALDTTLLIEQHPAKYKRVQGTLFVLGCSSDSKTTSDIVTDRSIVHSTAGFNGAWGDALLQIANVNFQPTVLLIYDELLSQQKIGINCKMGI